MHLGQLRVDCNVNIVPWELVPPRPDPDHRSTTTPNHTTASAVTAVSSNSSHNQEQMKHPRVEVKNLNSIQQIEDCIQYEAYRQLMVLEERYEKSSGDTTTMSTSPPPLPPLLEETRTYNAVTKRTELLRYKDQQNDYRFLPEMDLPPCVINQTVLQDCATIAEYIQKYTPALPDVVQQHLIQHMGLPSALAQVLVTNHPAAVQYFRQALWYALVTTTTCTTEEEEEEEDVVATTLPRPSPAPADHPFPPHISWEDFTLQFPPKSHVHQVAPEVANLLCNVLFHLVKEDYRSKLLLLQPPDSVSRDGGQRPEEWATDGIGEITMEHCPITARQLGEIVQMILTQQISHTMAKQLIQILSSPEYSTSTSTGKGKAHISPRVVAQERNIQLITNADTLRDLCVTEMIKYPLEVQVYQKGGKFKVKMEKLFIGKVMGATRGNAHPERLRDIVIECLASSTTATTTTPFHEQKQQQQK